MMSLQQWVVGGVFLVVGVFLIGFDLFTSLSKQSVKKELGAAKEKLEVAASAAASASASLSDVNVVRLADPHDSSLRAFAVVDGAPTEPVEMPEISSAKDNLEKSKTAAEDALDKVNSATGTVFTTLATSHPLAILGVVLMIAGSGALGVTINLSVG